MDPASAGVTDTAVNQLPLNGTFSLSMAIGYHVHRPR